MSFCLARCTLGWKYTLGDGLPLFTELPRARVFWKIRYNNQQAPTRVRLGEAHASWQQ
jgi:hypothetical protein